MPYTITDKPLSQETNYITSLFEIETILVFFHYQLFYINFRKNVHWTSGSTRLTLHDLYTTFHGGKIYTVKTDKHLYIICLNCF
jgi:hypothetical protein